MAKVGLRESWRHAEASWAKLNNVNRPFGTLAELVRSL